jgi:hypothetical protein
MKHCRQVVLGALLLCLVPFTALAGAGYLAIHGDEQGTSCDIANPAPGALVTVYVFHEFGIPGESAAESRFRIEVPSGWSFITFTATAGYTPVGDARSDLSVGYPACVSAPVKIGSVLYISTPGAPPCTQLRMEPPDRFPSILAFDCSFVEYSTVGQGVVINPQGSCCCQCLATEPSTWGRVKGLYR